MNTPKHRTISIISTLHYLKLVGRSCLFVIALVIYIIIKTNSGNTILDRPIGRTIFLAFIWIVFVIEMLLRFFPSKFESMGCQKQFSRNFKPTANFTSDFKLNSAKTTFIAAALWILLNAVIGVLYFTNVIDKGILLLISLAFSICDMICILFFCPFQEWIMKNKCCTSCRIYNWDFAMMFTPLIFINSFYTYSLLAFAIALLIKWEVYVRLHPERFSEETNQCLSCSNCKEKLCQHKKSLQVFLKKQRLKQAKLNRKYNN